MPNDPKGNSVSMARIGEQLKDAREKRSLTIDQVQKQTRMHATVLKALEEGRCDDILTPIYTKSFLRKYAEYLGLDGAHISAEYAKTRPVPAAPQAALTSRTVPESSFDGSRFFNIVISVAVISFIVIVALFAAGKIAGALKRSSGAKPASAAKAQAVSIRPAAAAVQKKKVSEKPAVSQKETAPKEQPLSKPAAVIQAAVPKSIPIKLVLKVKDRTMVKLRADGNLIFERVLARGTVESFTAKEKISISVGKGEAIELFLNGKSLGSPGKGPMKNLEITREGLKIR